MKNKGFAITALLYGLSIMGLMTVVLMMSIMQNSRKNTSTLVRGVEQELNSYGQTAIDYTSTGDYIVPSDQRGYYKLELCGNNTLTTGSVFFKGGEKLNITVGTTSTVKVVSDDAGNDIGAIMTSGSSPYINGMAKFHNSGEIKKYPFINGQIIESTSCTNGLVMNKVSSDAPTASNTNFVVSSTTENIFNSVKKVTTGAKAKVWRASYTANSTAAPSIKAMAQSSNHLTHTLSGSDIVNVSEIYVDYEVEPGTATAIQIYGDADQTNGKTISPSSSYSFKKTGYTFSRFGPIKDNTIQVGNYVIALTTKESSKITLTPRKALSTSAYTPAAGSGKTMCQNAWAEANNAASTNIVKYGSESLARPVVLKNYKGANWQKWRFESISGKYKITEIEEYKPFEVNKHDTSLELTGPVLVCGEYTCFVKSPPEVEEFKSTDAWRDNENQKWTLAATGLGTYRFQTNTDVGVNQYLYYDSRTEANGGTKKFYVTSNASNASLFYIYNANL